MKRYLTLSLPDRSLRFAEAYQDEAGLNSLSDVVEEALRLLEQRMLFDMFTEMGKNADAVADMIEDSELAAEDFLDEDWA